MHAVAYTVIASLPDQAVRDRYIAWLEDGHVDAVIRGGAHSAMIIRHDHGAPGDPWRVETRYIFATRALFAAYERDHAPALRAQGVALFGSIPGVSFVRSVGDVL